MKQPAIPAALNGWLMSAAIGFALLVIGGCVLAFLWSLATALFGFSTVPFVPHGACGPLGQRIVLGWQRLPHLLIWASYMSIPAALIIYVVRGHRVQLRPFYWLFAGFIFACGMTHLMAVWVFTWPVYIAEAITLWLCAAISAPTAVFLLYWGPTILRLPTPATLKAVSQTLMQVEAAMLRTQLAIPLSPEQRIDVEAQLARLAESMRLLRGDP